MKCKRYFVSLIPTAEGNYFVCMKDFPQALTQGDTYEQAMEMIEDCVRIWLEEYRGKPLPEQSLIEDCYKWTFNKMNEEYNLVDWERSMIISTIDVGNLLENEEV